MFEFSLNLSQEIDKNQIFDLIIVGGGPAGLTAGLYAARYKLNVLMIEKSFISGGQLTGIDTIENYPGFAEPVLGSKLAQNMAEQAKSFGLKSINAFVDSLDLQKDIKEVKVGNDIYKAKTILITTGTSSGKLGIKHEDEYVGKGISYCATCDGPMFPDKKVLVIGGGNNAVKEALFIAKYAKEVIIIHSGEKLNAAVSNIDKLKDEQKIKVLLNSSVKAIDFSDLKNKTFEIENSSNNKVETITADGMFIFVGTTPNTSLVEGQLELEKGYIKTDCSLQTNISGVFAAGDVIVKELRQVATAVGDGALVAYKINKYLSNL
ncbi:MAG: FAD-dependent oxidoreductase [Candidatus Cloacimonadales bacterium]|jgi:thioredoxin reductase (NADPH)|nr:FAD-dependent oxidoreductase [Candidatus Cloacimonadota bacterium]MDD2649928.1 FAD-dependent oxidoreductase [Candidatus Cloacimonadota bacterium]MDX9976492.1 FAD-dependent oxidoreductase [Candidatus Cloacimonadales bacterium]